MIGWRRSGSYLVSGVALLDKPVGISSFAALGALRRIAGTRRVGHTGTLDPCASGLLVALVGPATRLARYFSGLSKCYEAEFVFGAATDTDDGTGTVIERCSSPSPDRIRELIGNYTGTFEQLPPRYSAVHVNGRRAYQIAREGKNPDVPRRSVTVSRFEVKPLSGSRMSVAISCSAGTYIRSIARDLAAEAGSCGHVSGLRRTSVGPFSISEAGDPEEFTLERNLVEPLRAISELPGISLCEVGRQGAVDVRHGRVPPEIRDGTHLVLDGPVALHCDGRLIGVGRWHESRWKYDLVMPHEGD